jgi:cytoskeletal protein CcmA (bactofilin family)
MSEPTDQKGTIYIGEGVTVTGSFNIPGRAVVNGTLNGELTADELMVGQQGQLTGQIAVRNADIHGQTHDTLTASNHLVIRSTGRVHGKASYGELEIERGGLVAGTIVPSEAKSAPPAAKPGAAIAFTGTTLTDAPSKTEKAGD